MKLSVFTPTHRPEHILDTYQSLLKQKGDVPWEWIIVANGGVKPENIPAVIRDDNHVRIIPTERKGIGSLKNFACYQCTGDVFVELDHDDTLTTDAFEELAAAYLREPQGFYYSDFINLRPNGTCETYGAHFGWETYRVTIDGRSYKACKAFEPCARTLCQIFYAPNHVRAWSRAAYMRVKGHDVTLTVGDDHELLCRTYIAGVPFVLIPKPLYIYRRYAGNSFVAYNKEIQTQQQANMNKYLYQLIAAECSRDNLLCVDIGRETECKPGWKSYDIVANHNNDRLYCDYDSVGCIRAFDVLQRISPSEIVGVMNRLYRILKPGGWLLTATPSIDDGEGHPGRGVFQDPSHRSYWSANNFWYYTDKKFATLVDDLQVRYQLVRCWTGYPSDWHRKNFIPYVHADLCALKGQRQPGECKI